MEYDMFFSFLTGSYFFKANHFLPLKNQVSISNYEKCCHVVGVESCSQKNPVEDDLCPEKPEGGVGACYLLV